MTTAIRALDVTYMHFAYFGEYGHIYDYDELEGAWAFEDRVFLTLAWTPDAFASANMASEGPQRVFVWGAAAPGGGPRIYSVGGGRLRSSSRIHRRPAMGFGMRAWATP